MDDKQALVTSPHIYVLENKPWLLPEPGKQKEEKPLNTADPTKDLGLGSCMWFFLSKC